MNVVRKTVNHNKRELVTLVGIFFICIFFTVMDSSYLSWNNFLLILQQSTINGIIAVGMTFAIMTGGIDLSVGAVYGIVIVAIAKMTVSGWNPILSLLIGLLLGCAAGCINGLLVTKLKLQPFIATLGTLDIFRGVAYVVTDGVPVIGVPDSYRVIFNSRLSNGIYIYVFVFLLIAVIMGVVLSKTRLGNYLYAVGGNEEAARLSGVSIDWVKIRAYMLCAFCAALAGSISLSNLGSGNPTAGEGYELEAIAACAIGGSRMAGGKGSVLGTVFGALLLASLKVGMIIMNVNTFYQYIVTGAIIVIAAFFEVIQVKLESKIKK
ncbi:MAG: ABC transporter permease [Lachnospiraceae bacterium]|nr:ABC transporter permease [Lachnospiraceae bacterium]